MEIVHVSPEFAPLIKAGGLADVVFSLSRVLAQSGHESAVILPFYDLIDTSALEDFQKTSIILTTPEGSSLITWEVYFGIFDKISLYLLKPNHPKNYFDRGVIYSEPDDNDRFILFSCAAALLIEEIFTYPIVHLHDWPTALIAPLLMGISPIVYTIHNLSYQGICSKENLEKVYLDRFITSLKVDPTHLSLAKGGIEYALAITTVSPTYAQEIQTSTYGCGFESLISHHSSKLTGILNGLDLDYWNPAFDALLPIPYSLHDIDLFEKKRANKQRLFTHFQKPFSDAPLICCVTRLVPQKGPDLIEAGIIYALDLNCSFALSGTLSDATKTRFSHIDSVYGSHPQALFNFTFDEPLAHLMYAAADYILIPSIFEPCGLTQMIALLYGTIPIVTATGGLKDTIIDISFSEGNGILLENTTPEAVQAGIRRALEIPIDVRKNLFLEWNRERFSWETSLSKYLTVYESLFPEP